MSIRSNRWNFRPSTLAAAMALLAAAPVLAQQQKDAADKEEAAPRAKDDTVRLGTITIVGEGTKLGAGQMLLEDAVKGRSTVTRSATEKDRATGNAYQAVALLPGINTFNHDATGLFGGGLTMRGFSSDQLGFTINGVPVNDSGNFAVFPQEYIDQENVCTLSVAQGNADVESPHVGASGGSVSVVTCDPEDKRRFRFAQTLGQLDLSRSFVRFDSGRFAGNQAKVFLSYSHTEADKWKGKGKGERDHIDAAFRWDISDDHKILGAVLYNRAINNNIASLSLAQLNAGGYDADFSPTFTPGHLPPVNGTAQTEVGPTPAYYKLSLNPFENAIGSLSGSFKLAEATYLKVQPYFWYGYGTGGVQQNTLSESAFLNPATATTVARTDLNGDTDTLDRIIVYRGSVTKTSRPGITAEINKTIANHQLRLGVWYERATHRQTQPAVPVDAQGNPATVWLNENRITRPDGSLYQGRDWKTISTASQAYITDSISFMDDRGLLSLGLRTPRVNRDVTNYANEGFSRSYNMQRSYDDLLPQVGVRFHLDKSQQLFLNVGKNFRAAPNFAFTGSNVRFNATTGQVELLVEAKPETSVMTDLGYRLQTRLGSLSATFFNSDFKDRQANAFDPISQRSSYTNAGRVNNRGLELEAGSASFKGFTAYASLTLQKSEVKDNVTVGANQTLPTSGKQFTLTPETMVGASLQYAVGPLYARVKLKYTGTQYATLMNDEKVPSYTVGDFDAGYNFGKVGMLSNTLLRLNLSNIGNAKYRNPSSGSVLNSSAVTTPQGTVAPATVLYYLGSPRFFSLSLSADFQ